MAASGSGGGASSAFSQLLASSRLAAQSPSIPQVYTAPLAYQSRGDFGLKQRLPVRSRPVGSLRYIEAHSGDTVEGVPAWREREHEVLTRKRFLELNVRLWNRADTRASPNDNRFTSTSLMHDQVKYQRGILGPRVTTSYDRSTRRLVPTDYERVVQGERREYLENEARRGTGPVYREDLYASGAVASGLDDDGPYGRMAGAYTHTIPLTLDFHAMTEKQFERYLAHLRELRPQFNERASLRAASRVRQEVAHLFTEADAIQNEEQLPLPEYKRAPKLERDADGKLITREQVPTEGKPITADLWNESRMDNTVWGSWMPWLQNLDAQRATRPDDDRLPPTPSSNVTGRLTAMHITGGLQYSQPDTIQTQLMADPVPARLLQPAPNDLTRSPKERRGRPPPTGYHAAMAGRVVQLDDLPESQKNMVDWAQGDAKRGVISAKPVQAMYSAGDARVRPEMIWGLKAERETKSKSAIDYYVNRLREERSERDWRDPLAPSALSPQYGQINIKARAIEPASAEQEDSARQRLARGVPGSTEWIGSIDGKLGRRASTMDDEPLDYTSAINMANALGPRYSRREKDAVFRYKSKMGTATRRAPSSSEGSSQSSRPPPSFEGSKYASQQPQGDGRRYGFGNRRPEGRGGPYKAPDKF